MRMNDRQGVDGITQIYKALSEEMRLRILMLLTQGELCVCDIMAVLEEPQSKVSRHLAYLKHSGFIQGKRVGTWMHYFLKDSLDELIASHLEFLKKEMSRLDWAKKDVEKMCEVQAQKLCEESTARKPVSKNRKASHKKQASTKRKKKVNS
jgi:ArsR family transcriptional regulator, arsenate/arsenite/antimonite-responsive transcriptional repressor